MLGYTKEIAIFNHPSYYLMKHKRLSRSFYTRPTLAVARNLLGKYIIRKLGKKYQIGKIIETEAYIGPKDRASHAYNGKRTPRNQAEFLIGGHIYIYLVYGMYWQLNIATSLTDKPECVLIRALEPMLGKNQKNIRDIRGRLVKIREIANGPGKLCNWLGLDKSFYGEDLTKSKRIWLKDRGEKIKPSQIRRSARIGIDYAGPYWSKRKWRFLLK